MSEKELLKALEEDTKREYAAILENARNESEAIIKGTMEEQKGLQREKFEKAKTSMESERLGMLANARLHANEVALKERQLAIARVFEKASDRLKGLCASKDYSKIFERLLKEAVDKWRIYMKGEKGVIMAPKEDMPFLKGFHDAHYEIAAEESNAMSAGVVIISKDKRYKMENTLHSRLEKARPELVALIDRMLFKGE
ncbi:MAG: hypothetical protein HY026_04625 [Deltaproteobacteria bacterium]|nr:hypothetical protein [Deltaproteobacteria bacterium]